MRKAVARSYTLLALFGVVTGLATLGVRDIYLGFTLPTEFGPKLVASSFLAIALPDVLIAVLVMTTVFSRRGAISRTFNGLVGGLLYAVTYCVAQYAFARYAGERFGLDSANVLYSVPILIVCGVFIGAAIGQRSYSRSQQKESDARRFSIVGIVIATLFYGAYEVLTGVSKGEVTTVAFYAYIVCALVIVVLAVRAFIRHKRFDWVIQQR